MSEKLKHKICGQVQGPISCKYLLSMLYDLSGAKGELIMSARNIRPADRLLHIHRPAGHAPA